MAEVYCFVLLALCLICRLTASLITTIQSLVRYGTLGSGLWISASALVELTTWRPHQGLRGIEYRVGLSWRYALAVPRTRCRVEETSLASRMSSPLHQIERAACVAPRTANGHQRKIWHDTAATERKGLFLFMQQILKRPTIVRRSKISSDMKSSRFVLPG